MASSATFTTSGDKPVMGKIRRFAPVIIIGGAIAAAFAFGVGDHLSFEALRDNRELLTTFVT